VAWCGLTPSASARSWPTRSWRRCSSRTARSRGASPPAAVAASRRAFYREAAAQLSSGSVPLSSPYDFEISKLFAPAMVAGLLEPVQMTAESICVGRLGVAQVTVAAAGWCAQARG